jgi:beta-N-acetylhexosaminidase
MAGFRGKTIPNDLRALAREFDLGGTVLFDRNIEAPEQVAELSYEVQALGQESPLWVSVDQEGGRVARLGAPFTVWPAMNSLGRCGDVALARRFATALARELKSVGISLDYAPVLDVHTNSRNPVIGDRALSEKADDVARLGAAIVEGLQAEGVAACGKHFPGHGDTDADSHTELPVVEHPPDRFREVELVPFREAIAGGVASIMTAHVLYPALDEAGPATLSHTIVTELLRKELGFEGIIATDDMSMSAISGDRSLESATVDAIRAGCDLVLLCAPDVEGQVRAIEAVIRAVENEELPATRVDDAFGRNQAVKSRFIADVRNRRPLSGRALDAVLNCEEHDAVAEEMRRYA